jgi:tRNA modification GTPase
MDQLEGTLTSAIGRIDAMLFDLAARLEASLDFPDEGFHFITREEAGARLSAVRAALDALAREGRAGRLVREGRTLVIAGLPNAGKSSLFNALAGASRAIVAEMPGTTRDLVTERVEIDGVPVTLVDTAGLRDAGDVVEIEGVRRARDAQALAALRLVLVDGSVPLQAAAIDLVRRTKAPRLIVATKRDLPRAWELRELGQDAADAVDVSVVSGAGLAELRARAVQALAGGEPLRDVPAISNVRHLALVDDARAAVAKAAAELQEGATEELVLAELTAARRALEAITGRRSPDELLAHIFQRFCIGK